jgi:hypothetical protein
MVTLTFQIELDVLVFPLGSITYEGRDLKLEERVKPTATTTPLIAH